MSIALGEEDVPLGMLGEETGFVRWKHSIVVPGRKIEGQYVCVNLITTAVHPENVFNKPRVQVGLQRGQIDPFEDSSSAQRSGNVDHSCAGIKTGT